MATGGDSYDVIVVGAGLGGLSAAAALAKAGRSVALIERQDGPRGKRARVQSRRVHVRPGDPRHRSRVRDRVPRRLSRSARRQLQLDLLTMDTLYGVDVCGTRFTLPVGGVEPVIEYLGDQFPRDRDGIAQYMHLRPGHAGVPGPAAPRRAQGPRSGDGGAADAVQVPHEHPPGRDRGVRQRSRGASVLGAQWPYMGLPPSRLSFMAGTGVWMALMDPGPVYVNGSFQRLADALAGVVTEHGGDCIYGRRRAIVLLMGAPPAFASRTDVSSALRTSSPTRTPSTRSRNSSARSTCPSGSCAVFGGCGRRSPRFSCIQPRRCRSTRWTSPLRCSSMTTGTTM